MPRRPDPTFAPLAARIVLAAAVLVPACSTVELSEESRQAIRQVRVSAEVPEVASVSGRLPEVSGDTRGSVWFSSLLTAPVGVVFEVIDREENAARETRIFRKFLRDAEIDVPVMVRNRFLKHLAAAKLFDSIYADPGDATFKLRVEHGLADGLGLRGTWRPWVRVEGVLVDNGGEVLWQFEAEVDDGRVPELEHPAREAAYLRKAYAVAVDLATAALVEHLAQAARG
jgi:hypothetical protein